MTASPTPEATSKRFTRLIWFSLGILTALLYSQLTWRRTGPAQVYLKAPEQEVTDKEQDQVDGLLKELNDLRKDLKRMKASRDTVKEKLVACETKTSTSVGDE